MNNTLKHLVNNKKQSLGIIIILAIILFVQLYLTSELWVAFYPSGKEKLNESCYSFVVSDPTPKALETMVKSVPADITGILDIQLVGTGLEYHDQLITAEVFDEQQYKEWFPEEYGETYQEIRLIAPLTPLSSKRINNYGSYDPSKINDSTIILLDNWRTYSDSQLFIGKYVYISGEPYEIVGAADIYEVEWDNEIYNKYIGSIGTVLKTTSRYEVVFQFDKPLKNSMYKKLLAFVEESFEVTDAEMPYVLNEEESNDVTRFSAEILICIAVCLFLTMDFIEYVIENRKKEFRVYLICGASSFYNVKLIFYHVSLLCLFAEITGWTTFILLMQLTRLVAFDKIPLAFALINIFSFWILLMIVMIIYLIKDHIQKRKLGLSRIAR